MPASRRPTRLDTAALWAAVRDVSPSECHAGSQWYDKAFAELCLLGLKYGIGPRVMVCAAATLSPGLRWTATVELLERLLIAHRDGESMPRNGHATFGFRPRERAWQIIRTGIASSRGVKVEAFAAALLGDTDAVVVDRHLIDAAGLGGTDRRRSISAAQRRRVADTVRSFAAVLGVTPRDLTTALWLRATA